MMIYYSFNSLINLNNARSGGEQIVLMCFYNYLIFVYCCRKAPRDKSQLARRWWENIDTIIILLLFPGPNQSI